MGVQAHGVEYFGTLREGSPSPIPAPAADVPLVDAQIEVPQEVPREARKDLCRRS